MQNAQNNRAHREQAPRMHKAAQGHKEVVYLYSLSDEAECCQLRLFTQELTVETRV